MPLTLIPSLGCEGDSDPALTTPDVAYPLTLWDPPFSSTHWPLFTWGCAWEVTLNLSLHSNPAPWLSSDSTNATVVGGLDQRIVFQQGMCAWCGAKGAGCVNIAAEWDGARGAVATTRNQLPHPPHCTCIRAHLLASTKGRAVDVDGGNANADNW